MEPRPKPDRSYVCLGCGAPMTELACKLRCGACGYFEDCGNGLTPPPTAIAARPARAPREP